MANGRFVLGKQSGGTLGLVFPDSISNTEVMLPESGNLVSVDTAVTDNAIARYDGTTGKLQNSGVYVDDSGNVGIGATPSTWDNTKHSITLFGNGSAIIGGISSPGGDSNSTTVFNNCYYNNGWKYIYGAAYPAVKYECGEGLYRWYIAPLGTAGNPITWTNAMTLDANGNLLLQSGTGALGYGPGSGGTVTQLTSKSADVTLNKPTGTIIMSNSALAIGAVVYFNLYNSLVGSNDTIIINMDRNTGDLGKYKIEYNIASGIVLIKITNQGSSSYSDALVLKFTIVKGAIV